MPSSVSSRDRAAPNARVDGATVLMLEHVCAQLPHDYSRRLVRDVGKLKLALGFERDVLDYIERRSGEFPAITPPANKSSDSR